MDGIVIKIVVNGAFSESVVLISIFNNWLLEITSEAKYLSVILEPLGGDLGDGILDLIISALNTSKLGWYSLGHGHNQIWVDILL